MADIKDKLVSEESLKVVYDVTKGKIDELKSDVSQLSEEIANWKSGAPEPASAVAEMTDTTKIYLYTGAEEGYTAGDWYYYNDSAWVSGGKYGVSYRETVSDDHSNSLIGTKLGVSETGAY